jgi:cytochrome c
LERLFKISGSPEGLTVSIQSSDTTLPLNTKKETSLVTWFNPLPAQFAAKPEEQYDSRGRYWMEKSDCFTCHEADKNTVGPSFQQIALRYENSKNPDERLIRKIKEGGSGVWGTSFMTPHPKLTSNEIKEMLDYILSFKASEEKENNVIPAVKKIEDKFIKPGFGAPLEGVHPSFDLSTIHKSDFNPKVGGLAFLPDGGLLVTTWDTVGGVYLLRGVETGDTSKIKVKRIAAGLAEPLGITVVDGKILCCKSLN